MHRVDYKVELQRYPRLDDLKSMMTEAGFDELQDMTVEFPYALGDIRSFRDRAFSSLHLIPPEAFERGLARMEEDL